MSRILKNGAWCLLSLCLMLACPRPERQAPRLDELLGDWAIELRSSDGGPSASGTARMTQVRPTDVADSTALLRMPAVTGTHDIAFDSLVGHGLSTEVMAATDSTDGAVGFVFGACCDRGEISAVGTLVDGRIKGRWEETFVKPGGRSGTFEASRIP